jgi:hypothetical protein
MIAGNNKSGNIFIKCFIVLISLVSGQLSVVSELAIFQISRISGAHSPFTIHHSQLTNLCGQLSVVSELAIFQIARISETHSPFTTHNSPTTAKYGGKSGVWGGVKAVKGG